MDFLDLFFFWSGILVILHSIPVIYRWLISYISSPVDLKKKYDSEYALVTGANSGLGLQISIRLAQQGYNIIGLGRNLETLEKAKQEVESKGKNVKFYPVQADFASYEKGVKVVEDVLNTNFHGKDIRVAIINAGYGMYGRLLQLDNEKIHSFVTTMCTSYLQLARLFIDRNKQTIYNSQKDHKALLYFTSSVAADFNAPLGSLYCSVKAYKTGVMKHLSIEKAGTNLDVTTMQPGFFASSLFRSLPPFFEKFISSDSLFPTSSDVCDCVMKTLGREPVVDCSANSLVMRMFVWAIGEYPTYFISRFLV